MLLLHLADLDIVALAAAPLVVAFVLPGSMTLFTRLVIGAGSCFCANFLVGWIIGLAGIPLMPWTVSLVLLALLALALGLGWARAQKGILIDGGDVMALLAGMLVLVVLWLPTARDTSEVLLSRLAGNGEDNSAHLGIVRALTLEHRLLFGAAQHWSGRLLPGHTAYPPGFHVNVALILSATEKLFRAPQSAQLVRAYVYVSLGIQVVWAITTVLAVRALARLPRNSLMATAVVALATSLFFIFGPPFDMMQFGFQPQAAALWMLTLGLLAVAAPQLEGYPQLALWLVLLAMVGTTWTWYLVSPAAWVMALTVVWFRREALMPRWPINVATLAAAFVLSLPPLVAGFMVGAPGYINSPGGVFPLDRAFIGVLALIALVAVVLPARLPGNQARWVMVATLLAATAMAFAIHWYQVRTAGTASYYYEKVLYTIAIAAAVGAGAVALIFIAGAQQAIGPSRWKTGVLLLTGLGVTWLSSAMATPANPGRHYLTGVWIFPDVGAMHHILVTPPPQDSRQVLFWGDTPQRDDYFASRFASGIYLRNSDARNTFMAVHYVHQDDFDLLAFLRQSPDGLWLITRNPRLRDELTAAGFSSADLDRVVIDFITEPPGGAEVLSRARSHDISPRGLFPSLFRQR